MNREDRIFTIPNVLSLIRLAMLPPILMLLRNGQNWAAVGVMALSAFTDLMDGIIARRFDQKSNFGRIIDPVADKVSVLAVAVFLAFSPAYSFPVWYLIFLLVREAAVIVAGILVIRGKKIVMESTRSGKNSAFANALVLVFFVLGWLPYGWVVLTVAVILTIYSTGEYWFRFRSKIQERTG